MMNDPLISVKGLSVDYISEGADINAVQNVSFDIYPGEVFGLVGESGSGKSTVVQAMMRILPPPALINGGKVLINNQDMIIIFPGGTGTIHELFFILTSKIYLSTKIILIGRNLKELVMFCIESMGTDLFDLDINKLVFLDNISEMNL